MTRQLNGSGRRTGAPLATGSPVVRTAGGLTVLVGLLNTVFGVLAVASDAVTMEPGTIGWLLVLGVTTAGIGVLILRGSALAAVTALTVFGLLLVVELGRMVTVPAVGAGVTLRVGILVLLVMSLALALRRDGSAA